MQSLRNHVMCVLHTWSGPFICEFVVTTAAACWCSAVMRWANPDGLREAGSFSEVPLAFLILEGASLAQLFHLWYVANSSCFFPCVHCDTSLVRQTPLKPNALTPCAGRGLRLRRPTPPPPPVPSKASESARISPFMTTVEEKERRRRRKRTCFSSFHPQIEQSVAVASVPKVRMYAFLSSLSFFSFGRQRMRMRRRRRDLPFRSRLRGAPFGN